MLKIFIGHPNQFSTFRKFKGPWSFAFLCHNLGKFYIILEMCLPVGTFVVLPHLTVLKSILYTKVGGNAVLPSLSHPHWFNGSHSVQ